MPELMTQSIQQLFEDHGYWLDTAESSPPFGAAPMRTDSDKPCVGFSKFQTFEDHEVYFFGVVDAKMIDVYASHEVLGRRQCEGELADFLGVWADGVRHLGFTVYRTAYGENNDDERLDLMLATLDKAVAATIK